MSDQARREAQRKLAQDQGDEAAQRQVARAEARSGHVTRVERLRRFVGRWVYVEGARMNYIGCLVAVTETYTGDPAELLLERLFRVGDWNADGPNDQHCYEMPTEEGLPAFLPWCAVDELNLCPAEWVPA